MNTIPQIQLKTRQLCEELKTSVFAYVEVAAMIQGNACDSLRIHFSAYNKACGKPRLTIEAAEESLREELSETKMLQRAKALRDEADALERTVADSKAVVL